MLEIHERKDSIGYESITNSIVNKEFIHIVESFDSGKVNGYGVYTMTPEEISLYDFQCDDLNVCDGIVRTVLFKGMLSGIEKCQFNVTDENKNSMLKRLGFIGDKNAIIDNINDFMGNCKKCKEL